MKVLVVTFNDSDNLTIENVLYELEARGHEITIFAPFRDQGSIRMFEKLKAEIRPFDELNRITVKEFDVAFCSVMMMKRFKLFDIYCFVYSPYFDETFMTDGADFMFTYKSGCMPRCSYKCAFMPVGSPKNDKLITKHIMDSKRILFVDSGHMPFGTEGKTQIANMILEICRSFPDYELCIKPRWLRDNGIHYTHRNTEHLYTIIEKCCDGDIPSNLNMLNEHLDLQDLIDSSVSVITLYSGAHLDVILRDKGLIVATGWDNEDKWDIRNNIQMKIHHELFSESGCVVHYSNVTKYLPKGIHASEAYKEKMFQCKQGASKIIADVMEYVYHEFLCHGFYPAAKEYDYETYRTQMKPDSSMTMKSLKQERIRDILQQQAALNSYKLSSPIDFSEYFEKLDDTYKNCPLTEAGFEDYAASFSLLWKRILVKNADILKKDAIDQSFLIQALYDMGEIQTILEMPSEEILCTGPYHYYLGRIYSENGKTDAALEHFCAFLEEANSRAFIKYPQENDLGISIAYNYVFQNYDGRNIWPQSFARLCIALYEQRDATIIGRNNCSKAHDFLPRVAELLKDTEPELAWKCFQIYTQWEHYYNIEERDEQINRLQEELAQVQASKLYRLCQTVKWIVRKTKGGIRCLQEHGLSYTVHRGIKKAKRAIAEVKRLEVFRIWNTFNHMVMAGYRLYEKLVSENGSRTHILLSAPSLGDPYILGSYFKAYATKRCPDSLPIFGVCGKASDLIAKLYGIEYTQVYTLNEFHQMWKLMMFDSHKLVRAESMHHHCFYRHIAILAYIEGLHEFNLASLMEAYLDVCPETDRESPKFIYDEKALTFLFEDNHLQKGKTVVLLPYAKSVKNLPGSFWMELTERLQELGISVCTNSAGSHEPPIEGTPAVSIPLQHAVPFLEYAGASVGLRSGFQDVTSTAKCLKIALHPKDNFTRGLVCDINESYCLSEMYHQPDQYDWIYSVQGQKQLIDDIVHMVVNHLPAMQEKDKEGT